MFLSLFLVLLSMMLDKINKLKSWQIAVIFIFIGFVTFFSGLNSPFQNDDSYQIVNNTPVHSIANLPSFFSSSTFFNGEKLTGVYYRPLMTTTFSLIYSFFGDNPFFYHFFQLTLYIAAAFVLFLVFKHFLKQTKALFLALIFLVHPLNSQIVYSIPTMQDVLFFFFGILAIWMLIKDKSLWKVVLLLFLSMLSKESGILFTLIASLYLYLFDRQRIISFFKTVAIPIVLYFALKISAVGFAGAHHAAPINELGFIERMMTAPSIMLFYIGKFLFPAQLSLGYFWTYPNFSVEHVLAPLFIDLVVIGLFTYLGFVVKKRLSKKSFLTFLFFATWTVMGIGLYLQVIPGLDFTACETWFYFAMAGLLGMIGVSASLVKQFKYRNWIIVPIVLIIIALGIRSNLRGYDYSSQYKLATVDVSVTNSNFGAMNNIAQNLIDQGKYNEAIVYAEKSIQIYPIVSNYVNLGVALQQTGKYKEAIEAYDKSLIYGNINIIYENIALIHIVSSKPADTEQFFKKAFVEYPHDFKLWLYYAVFEGAIGSRDAAINAIINARNYGQVPSQIYDGITKGIPFTVPILGQNILVK